MRRNHSIDSRCEAAYARADESDVCPVTKEKGKADRSDFHEHWGRGVVGEEKRERWIRTRGGRERNLGVTRLG